MLLLLCVTRLGMGHWREWLDGGSPLGWEPLTCKPGILLALHSFSWGRDDGKGEALKPMGAGTLIWHNQL